jgi:5'-3' exonuclease
LIYEKYEAMREANIHPTPPLLSREKRRMAKEYIKQSKEITEEFKLALYEEYGVTNNPKRDLAFEVAQNLRSVDYYDVESTFLYIVQLIE